MDKKHYQKWERIVERRSDFWKNYMMILSLNDVNKFFGVSIKDHLTIRRGMMFSHWLNQKTVWNSSLQVEKKIKTDSSFIEKVEKFLASARKNLLKTNAELFKTDFSKFSNPQLLKKYENFCSAYRNIYSPFHLAFYLDSIEYKTRQWLSKKLQSMNEVSYFDDYFAKLSASNRLSLIQEEELSLLSLALKIKQKKLNSSQIEKLLELHAKIFEGLPVVNDETKPWTKFFFSSRLNKLIRKSPLAIKENYLAIKNYGNKINTEQQKLVKELQVPRLLQKYFYLLGLAVWIRLIGRNSFAMAHHASRSLFNEIAKRLKIKSEDVKWFTIEEVERALLHNQLPTSEQLADRQRVSALLFQNGNFKIYEGEQAEKIISKELGNEEVADNLNMVKGSCAFPGAVSGKVKIILSQKDIPKMRKGDIVVARMTTPEVIPALKKAAAIVTDEGGITCHAAIISREMGIPCVVGTKFATQIFKNNDIIKVNATKGVVEKA